MAYNYSNPFTPIAPAASPSTFTAAAGLSSGFQILFSGLPLDVAEKDLRDLLLAEPMSLPAATTRVRCLHNSISQFLGLALVQVEDEADAERYVLTSFPMPEKPTVCMSSQEMETAFRLFVQHILPPTQPLPSASVIPFQALPAPVVVPIQSAAAISPQQPKHTSRKRTSEASTNGTRQDKSPGLKLLARMGKPAHAKALGPKEKQLELLAAQKANLGKRAPGAALLARLALPARSLFKTRGMPSRLSSNSRPRQLRVASGNEKVGRAKARAEKDSMDVDVDLVRVKSFFKEKAVPKTQKQLDEEMRVWDRTRRFGPA
ncbi:MAG: hypothetical protein TREMPRED_001407 [Tremellales sp. Tagirdzhanova-0007]|nr:MAG: hypothetical protein TREMPRED_001407 [Tremellales sp. Tagirdzhanova-0007]